MATQKNLIKNVTKKLSCLKPVDASSAVNFIIDYIKDQLQKNNRIEIRGFGSLSIRKRKHADSEGEYNTVYYRMSKNAQNVINTCTKKSYN